MAKKQEKKQPEKLGMIQELRNEKGQLHSDPDTPTIIRIMKKPKDIRPEHRAMMLEAHGGKEPEEGPIEQVEYEFYSEGKKHRPNGRPAIISPNYVEWWVEGKPHRDGGAALNYEDGDKVFHLNGVISPDWLVETPAEKLDPKEILKLSNVEQRREGIRKVGIERMLAELKHKVLDSDGDYELLEVQLSPELKGNYLKMKNPSIGVWHLEGVENDCRTIKEALDWRNHGHGTPKSIS